MWFLSTTTLELIEFPQQLLLLPRYAILSHTWDSEEVTFQEMKEGWESITHKAGFKKIRDFCEVAKSFDFEYAWVDTCCIDKRNSAELSEAINSMFKWYHNAGICVVYLVDVPGFTEMAEGGPNLQVDMFMKSRYFTRGWTLQELIAPSWRRFFARDWSLIGHVAGGLYRGVREPGVDLIEIVSRITGISTEVLWQPSRIESVCVARRMSWAAWRQTTRSEDIAYSLMGLFSVNMPIIYGEGQRKAFRRLQDEIMKTTFDQTIFAWPHKSSRIDRGLLASSPWDFRDVPNLEIWTEQRFLSPYGMTNKGLNITLNVLRPPGKDQDGTILAALQCEIKTASGWKILLIRLRNVKNAGIYLRGQRIEAYRRVGSAKWDVISEENLDRCPYEELLVLENEHLQSLIISVDAARSRKNATMETDVGIVDFEEHTSW